MKKRRHVPRWRRGLKGEIWLRCMKHRHAMPHELLAMIIAAAMFRARMGLPV